MNSKLTRVKDGMVFGVAEGLANYMEIDVTIIRLLFVLFTLAGGPGLIVYLVLALIMPAQPRVSNLINSDGEPVVVSKEVMHDIKVS